MAKKKLTLTIKWADIVDAVKIDTHIKGTIDKSADDNASRLAYNEAAGDDESHERKITRALISSVEKLTAEISDMLAGNTDVSNSYVEGETITIKVDVDSRFNASFSSTLARLCSQYIQNNILFVWWGAVGNSNQTQFYTALCADNLVSIRKCFNKKAPTDPGVDILDTGGALADLTVPVLSFGEDYDDHVLTVLKGTVRDWPQATLSVNDVSPVIRYLSSNTSIATVDSNGAITFPEDGDFGVTTITAIYVDETTLRSYTASYQILYKEA